MAPAAAVERTTEAGTRLAGSAILVFALAGIAWFYLESTPPRLGFEDTDDPALMLEFIRAYPQVFVQAGAALLAMSVSLTVAVLAIAEVVGARPSRLAVRSASAFGLMAATFFLFGGAVRIGSSGPLRHMAGLSDRWGEDAYVAAQVSSQAVLGGGLLALCLWAVGLSLVGLRTRTLPTALCVLGLIPAFRIVSGMLGPLGLLPDWGVLWLVSIGSIFGTILWCLLLGAVLIHRGSGGLTYPATHVGTADS